MKKKRKIIICIILILGIVFCMNKTTIENKIIEHMVLDDFEANIMQPTGKILQKYNKKNGNLFKHLKIDAYRMEPLDDNYYYYKLCFVTSDLDGTNPNSNSFFNTYEPFFRQVKSALKNKKRYKTMNCLTKKIYVTWNYSTKGSDIVLYDTEGNEYYIETKNDDYSYSSSDTHISSDSSSSSTTNNNSSTYKSNSSTHSTHNSNNYDAGYNDYYENGDDYDQYRYDTDESYRDGVDDAIEDEDY